jgi:hypothetical protein
MGLNSEELKKFLDSDFPLLEKFRDKAPGSYRHSQNVANICESIASELDLDNTLIKVAALYHDVGKINAPQYFSENQEDDLNPHDNLEPAISYQIISRHVSDSIMFLLPYKDIPREVLNIISQHHGDTIIKAFYNKSKNKVDGNFRYKSKSPQSTEAAVLMIADSVEATSRSMYHSGKMNTNDDRKKIVNSTVERLVDDDQLDNMKIGILKKVKKVLIKELESIYHKRVSYDGDGKDSSDDKTVAEAKKEKEKDD